MQHSSSIRAVQVHVVMDGLKKSKECSHGAHTTGIWLCMLHGYGLSTVAVADLTWPQHWP